jgi:hypothetical protein
MDIGDHLVGSSSVLGSIETLLRLENIDQVLWHPLQGLGRAFGGADIESAIHLHAIGAQELAVEAPGEFDRHRGLARARRPRNDKEGDVPRVSVHEAGLDTTA